MVFEKLNNTRDLGSMKTASGEQIKPGRLIRSGRLCLASEADKERLTGLVSVIVDFRSARELAESPDPVIPGAESVHFPIFREREAGVTRDKESEREAMRLAFEDPEATMGIMRRIYGDFAADDFAVSQYRRFVRIIIDGAEGAVLWHCTAGKDRAGFASVIVQELLGVDQAAIMADYLLTNENIREECDELIQSAVQRSSGSERAERAARLFFSAQREFLEATYEKAEALYGSFDGFLSQALGVTDADRAKLKQMYLA